MFRGKNLIGQEFGRLKVLNFSHVNKHGSNCWECICICGNVVNRPSPSLVRKDRGIISCGCFMLEHIKRLSDNKEGNYKHGEYKTRLYRILKGMKRRCYNKNDESYHNYGGRGIKIYQNWLDDFLSFKEWAIENGYKDCLTIDRIDVNGNYEPKNCRFISISEQQDNKVNTIYVEYKGETKTLSQWSKHLGVPYNNMRSRYFRGKRGEELMKPFKTRKRRDNTAN